MKNLKLNKLEERNLSEKQMRKIEAGNCTWTEGNGTHTAACACGCAYANSGGSSTAANGQANRARGLCTPNFSYEKFTDGITYDAGVTFSYDIPN
jgi:natural product precursor